MISLEEAQRLVLGNVVRLDRTDVAIRDSVGFVLVDDVRAPFDVPSFRNSRMDGFAVNSSFTGGKPAVLKISHSVPAGNKPSVDFDPSTAVRIMTGAAVPDAYDAVVLFEETEYDDNQVIIKDVVKPGENIRPPGDDLAAGELLFPAGRYIGPLDPGLLASLGYQKIRVIRKPRISVLSTGDELVQTGVSLEFGQVYDSNSYTIEAMTQPFQLDVKAQTIIEDNAGMLDVALKTDHDVVITSGGVSMGDRDFLPEAAKECGWRVLFHGVAVKPGKPIFVATRNRQVLFGLPGNPLSAAVTCAVIVIPVLKKMMGISNALPQSVEAVLDYPIQLPDNRTLVWPGKFTLTNGKLHVVLSDKSSSAALSALIDSDGLIFVSNDRGGGRQIVRASTWRELLWP